MACFIQEGGGDIHTSIDIRDCRLWGGFWGQEFFVIFGGGGGGKTTEVYFLELGGGGGFVWGGAFAGVQNHGLLHPGGGRGHGCP